MVAVPRESTVMYAAFPAQPGAGAMALPLLLHRRCAAVPQHTPSCQEMHAPGLLFVALPHHPTTVVVSCPRIPAGRTRTRVQPRVYTANQSVGLYCSEGFGRTSVGV